MDAVVTSAGADTQPEAPAPAEKKRRQQVPSIGRVVHFNEGHQVMAAIITEINDEAAGIVTLTIFPPYRTVFHRTAQHGEKPGCWSWPPRV